MTLDEAIKHAEEVMIENLKKTKGRNASDPIAINCFKCAEEHQQLSEWLKELKQLREKPRWIPVSEKLPNDREWYLGIFKEPDTGWINPLPFICDYVGRETKATTKEHWILRGFTDWDDYHIDYYFNLECVAWMPLPAPFEPQESEDI